MPSNFGTLTAGVLRHQITFLKNIPTKNERGTLVDNWNNPVYSTVAEYIPQVGTSYFQDAAINEKFQAIFRTRWRPDHADSSMMIDSPFGKFSIISVADVEGRHVELQFYCVSVVQKG